MANNKDKQTEAVSNPVDPIERPDEPTGVAAHGQEPPLGHALFRVMRALVFDDRPVPELLQRMAQLGLVTEGLDLREPGTELVSTPDRTGLTWQQSLRHQNQRRGAPPGQPQRELTYEQQLIAGALRRRGG